MNAIKGIAMINPNVSRRSFAQLLTGGAAMLAVAPKLAGAQSTPVASPAADAFPVTIEHAFGSTTIETKPVRIATIGWSASDALVALGTVPIQVPLDTYAGDENGLLPWLTAAIGDQPLPETRDDAAGLNIETIVAAEPDLIFAPYSGLTQEEYDQLSNFAPTIAFPEVAWTNNWQEITRTAGQVLGVSPQAEGLIAETEAYIAERAAEFPAIAGKTFIYGSVFEGFSIYIEEDARSQFLMSLGMVPSDFVKNLEVPDGNTFFVSVSLESAKDLVADVVLFWFDSQETFTQQVKDAHLDLIPGFSEGRFVPVIGTDLVMATSAWSTLSIQYALDAYLPLLDAAAQNVK